MYEYIYDKRELHESAIFEVEITRRNLETLWRKRNFFALKNSFIHNNRALHVA